MPNDNRTTLAAALIRLAEGCKLQAYQDTGGVWTIAFGRTKGVKEDDTCTLQQAESWLAEDAAPLFALVANMPAVRAAGYVDFGYNCGYTTLRHVLAGIAILTDFVHDRHGNMLPGLQARRALEQALIDSAS